MSENKPAVLVVEDEEAIRRGLCDVLTFQGFEPTGVGTGEEGLAEALTGRYDLIVLDLMLPGMSGYDVCDRIREKDASQAILMLTARGSEEDILEGFERGADDYVTKPFSVSELVARVRALLRRRGGVVEREADESFAFGEWNVSYQETWSIENPSGLPVFTFEDSLEPVPHWPPVATPRPRGARVTRPSRSPRTTTGSRAAIPATRASREPSA